MSRQQEKTEKLRIFSGRLRTRMLNVGLQANEVAARIGVAPAAVSNWMNGTNAAKGKNLRNLAAVLQVEPEWLYGGSTYPAHRPTEPLANDVTPESAIRGKAHGHLDQVLDQCKHDLEQLSWTYIELKRRLPVREDCEHDPHEARIQAAIEATQKAAAEGEAELRRSSSSKPGHEK